MRIFTRRTIREFCLGRHGAERVVARRAFQVWQEAVEDSRWENFGDLLQTFRSTDAVGACFVFDVGHNKYRLIAKINFRLKQVFIRAILTHAEYDKGLWIDSCGCHRPAPRLKNAPPRPPKRKPNQ